MVSKMELPGRARAWKGAVTCLDHLQIKLNELIYIKLHDNVLESYILKNVKSTCQLRSI